jgi:hypothetical protein
MTITAAQFRAGACHLLGRSRPVLEDQRSVLIYTVDGGAETCDVMNDFSSTLAPVRGVQGECCGPNFVCAGSGPRDRARATQIMGMRRGPMYLIKLGCVSG